MPKCSEPNMLLVQPIHGLRKVDPESKLAETCSLSRTEAL